MEQIKQLRAASKMTANGHVKGTFEVLLRFAVPVGFEQEELADLNEESLRDALAGQVDEIMGQLKTRNSIEIGGLIDISDGDTEQAITLPIIELHRCDNCGALWTEDELRAPKHLSLRTDPGGVIPSGECLCGALCYPVNVLETDTVIYDVTLQGLTLNDRDDPRVTMEAGPGADVLELACEKYQIEDCAVSVKLHGRRLKAQ
jgi:hypothetical protein